eukprot:6658353-Lingulodinium_polyedra.AAC.1
MFTSVCDVGKVQLKFMQKVSLAMDDGRSCIFNDVASAMSAPARASVVALTADPPVDCATRVA